MNSPDPKVSQGNACVNVTDFFSVGGGACRVVRLNERPRVRPAELLATPAPPADRCKIYGSWV